MRDLNYQLKELCIQYREGSYATQAARHKILQMAADQLHFLGFRHLGIYGLKIKHVVALVEYWKRESITTGVLKNRMAHLRWWADKVGKSEIIPLKNAALNIGKRVYVDNVNRGFSLDESALEKITDSYTKVSLRLQAAYGLRREEAIKFVPSWADRADKIVLKATWCKGSKQREIPIRTEEQRAALKLAHERAGRGSLIPCHKIYIQHLKVFERQCKRAGLDGTHGLRHHYAQCRYQELTGWSAPAAGGPTSKELSETEKKLDQMARLTISRELGHERETVTARYLGR